jgi:Fe-Mn family superoxide dismutase
LAAGRLAQVIDASFGGFDVFMKVLSATTVSQFGSCWGWLVLVGGALKVVKTANAVVPFNMGQ